jgi:septum formation protein
MLNAARVPFRMVESNLDEEAVKAGLVGLTAAELAGALAERKALAVTAGPADLVLGSDQVLERDDGSMLGKAGSREELAEQLRSLRGRTHRLHAAAVIARSGAVAWRHTETVLLRMRLFSDAFLETYLAEEYEEVRWSVGGYHFEGRGAQLFERVEGSHYAVLGMPLLPLLGFLREQEILPE